MAIAATLHNNGLVRRTYETFERTRRSDPSGLDRHPAAGVGSDLAGHVEISPLTDPSRPAIHRLEFKPCC